MLTRRETERVSTPVKDQGHSTEQCSQLLHHLFCPCNRISGTLVQPTHHKILHINLQDTEYDKHVLASNYVKKVMRIINIKLILASQRQNSQIRTIVDTLLEQNQLS